MGGEELTICHLGARNSLTARAFWPYMSGEIQNPQIHHGLMSAAGTAKPAMGAKGMPHVSVGAKGLQGEEARRTQPHVQGAGRGDGEAQAKGWE